MSLGLKLGGGGGEAEEWQLIRKIRSRECQEEEYESRLWVRKEPYIDPISELRVPA